MSRKLHRKKSGSRKKRGSKKNVCKNCGCKKCKCLKTVMRKHSLKFGYAMPGLIPGF